MSGTAIESRVARIKARVAELTGTMEGSNAPNKDGNKDAVASAPPPIRRA